MCVMDYPLPGEVHVKITQCGPSQVRDWERPIPYVADVLCGTDTQPQPHMRTSPSPLRCCDNCCLTPSLQVYLDMSTPVGKLMVVETVTPVAPLQLRVLHAVYSAPTVPRLLAKVVLKSTMIQFEKDVPVW